MDILSPFISILWHYDWLFHRESCPRLDFVYSSRAWSSSPAYTWHCSLHYFFVINSDEFINYLLENATAFKDYLCMYFFWNVSSWFLLRLQCSLAIGHCCFQYVHVIHSYLKIFIGWIFTFLEPYTSPLFWFNVSTLFVVVCVTDEVHF